eukprot:759574-Hanusia_phi.AAC.9
MPATSHGAQARMSQIHREDPPFLLKPQPCMSSKGMKVFLHSSSPSILLPVHVLILLHGRNNGQTCDKLLVPCICHQSQSSPKQA